MSAPATQADHNDQPGQQAADARHYRQALHDLINVGTGFARLLHDTAQAQAAPPPAAPAPQGTAPRPAPTAPVAAAPAALVGLASAFDQVARAVRRCVMLAQSLDKPAPDPARHRAAARKQIIRAVEDTIQRAENGRARDRDTVDALNAELRERMDIPDFDEDITTRPIPEIIAEIRRDLGLDAAPGTRPFKRRTPADVARLCAQAAAPSIASQPGPCPRDTGRPLSGRPSGPEPDQPTPMRQLATDVRPHPGRTLPDDPAEAVATVLRHAARADARWRPPPRG